MTEEQNISLFNRSSDWDYDTWLNSDAREILNSIPKKVIEWICSEDMTDEEKEEHPTHETTGGYVKVLDKHECGQLWWDSLLDSEKDVIRRLPNFNADIFEQCTGIKTDNK